MNRQRFVAGLSLLCALVGCALVAPNAMALGTTAFECKPVKEGATGFTDEHCTKAAEAGKASFEHVLIPFETTNIKITNTETEKATVSRMKSTIAGVTIELTANGFTSCPGKTTIENKVNKEGKMEAAGTGCGEFTEVTLTKPSGGGCKSKSIVLNQGLAGNTEVGVVKEEENPPPPVSGTGYRPPPESEGNKETFATVTLEGCSAEALNGVYKVTGTVHANMPLEEGKLDGPTLRFTTAQTEKTLKFNGAKASFEGIFTMRAENGEKNPVALTTTES